MRFGPVPLDRAEGAVLAHAELGGRLRKGAVLTAEALAALAAAGVGAVTVARLDPGDVAEDAAAAALGAALAGAGVTVTPPVNGRVNLKATGPGLAAVDAARVHALNRVDPAITLATLPDLQRCAAGTLVATVKIITYAVAGPALDRALAVARGAVGLHPVVLRRAALVQTVVPGMAPRLVAKGERAVRGRLDALGLTLDTATVVPHEAAPLAAALRATEADMVLILTGSATSDGDDTGPAALRLAGGSVARFGMPVDPGNLLFLGAIGGRPVIGLPGCARSPALNGADWVLERLACGIAVTGDDIAAMGVGGLLKEIPSRPQRREQAPGRP
jgi:molybdenum cofactor cytidylyltransferase